METWSYALGSQHSLPSFQAAADIENKQHPTVHPKSEEYSHSIEQIRPGTQTQHTIDGVNFNLRLAPAATFPTGKDDDGEATVHQDFWIAETPVTYELWHKVYTWATHAVRGAGKYSFANAGIEGSVTGGGSYPYFNTVGNPPTAAKLEPVTMVSWGDTTAWLNALTEYHNARHGTAYTPVYTLNGQVLRDAASANTGCTGDGPCCTAFYYALPGPSKKLAKIHKGVM